MAAASPERLRVLLVEDEALVRLMLADMLVELGHEVVAEASRLDTAARAAADADYDLAVLDLNLGSGITYDVADVVAGRGKPLVLSTGYGGVGLNSRHAGRVVLQKPFTRKAMVEAIQRSLRQLPTPDAPTADRPAAA